MPKGSKAMNVKGKKPAATVKKADYSGSEKYGKYVSGVKSAQGKAMSAGKRAKGKATSGLKRKVK